MSAPARSAGRVSAPIAVFSADAAARAAAGSVYLSHARSPYFCEGMKAFAFEVAGQARECQHVVIPVGNGSLLIGAWKGVLELREAGVIRAVPRLHVVQAAGFSPIAAAVLAQPLQPTAATTVAGGIAIAAPPRLAQAVAAVTSTGGSAAVVADDETLQWQRRLAREEGIYCEPTSAAAFAGLAALVARGAIPSGARVLVPVTGSGLKDAAPDWPAGI